MKPTDGDEPDNNVRELVFKKNQSAHSVKASRFATSAGFSCPKPGVSDLDKLARDARVDEAFLSLLPAPAGTQR